MMKIYEDWKFSATALSTGTSTAVTSTAAIGLIEPPKPVTKQYPLTVDLPEGHLIRIAKVMLWWSFQEWLLQRILFALVTSDEGIARVTIGTPRATNIIDRIEQICQAKKINVKINTSKLKSELLRLEKLRDEVGHGVWMIDDFGRYCAVVYAGNWEAGDLQGTPKRITPHAKPIDEAYLAKIVSDIQASIEITKSLAIETRVAAPGP